MVDTRKMFCKNPDCLHKTFAEIHPFAAPRAKKTERLAKNIIHTSTQLSSLNASGLLKGENITACKSSICSLLKKMPAIVDKSSVTKVCVDDFALRKRFSYGTAMVDLGSHRTIDLIPSRETSDAAKWPAAFPDIQVVSRDGAAIYSSAAADSHPDAVQASDRFHLIKGLSEAINKSKLQSFVEGILKDLKAIKNGIIYSYNNGLAEGSVNKIKVIKRIMYGRNSFDLLKAKVLFHELFHVEFN